MSNLDKFSLFSGIIGLVADVLTLLGFVSVLTLPSSRLSSRANPEIITIWTFTLMVYSLIICLFFSIQFARNRWKKLGRTPDNKLIQNTSLILGYLYWLPASITWGIAIVHLFGNFYNLSINDSSTSILPQLGWLYFVIIVPLGGIILAKTSMFLNFLFNPTISG